MAAIDEKALLKRLFDRVGISKDEQLLLTEGEDGIKDLFDLVWRTTWRSPTATLPKTNLILSAVMEYVKANTTMGG